MTDRDWQKYTKVSPVWAKQMDEDFVVETPEGVMHGGAGDYLVVDEERTHQWPVKKEVFERTYMCLQSNGNARDWSKDWEMCEKATPGPWWAGTYNVWQDELCKCIAKTACAAKLFIRDDEDGLNAEFIAESRSALPYWLQRVRELEDELRDLRQIRASAQRYFEALSQALAISERADCDEGFRKPLFDAGLVAEYDYFILSDGFYDAEAVAFARRIVRKILWRTGGDDE